MTNKTECSAIGCHSHETDWYTINGSSSIVNIKIPICKDHVELARKEELI